MLNFLTSENRTFGVKMSSTISDEMDCIWKMAYHPTSEDMDKWVSYLNENFNTEETKVDWCFTIGRADVYAKGDLDLVHKAMKHYLPHLNNMLKNKWRTQFPFAKETPQFEESDLPQFERITKVPTY